MGLFSRKGSPTAAGAYTTLWPESSGLGKSSRGEDAEAQDRYVVYTTERRMAEGVPVEDMPVMQAANNLLYQLAAGTPVDEVPLIQGPVDVRFVLPWSGNEFAADALITDQRTIFWWSKVKAIYPGNVPPPASSGSALVIFNHISLVPRSEPARRTPLSWRDGFLVGFPVSTPPVRRQFTPGSLTVGVHFSQDGHANRRSLSVFETLREVERRAKQGTAI